MLTFYITIGWRDPAIHLFSLLVSFYAIFSVLGRSLILLDHILLHFFSEASNSLILKIMHVFFLVDGLVYCIPSMYSSGQT